MGYSVLHKTSHTSHTSQTRHMWKCRWVRQRLQLWGPGTLGKQEDSSRFSRISYNTFWMRTALWSAKPAIESLHSKVQKHTSLDFSQTKIITGVLLWALHYCGKDSLTGERTAHEQGTSITYITLVSTDTTNLPYLLNASKPHQHQQSGYSHIKFQMSMCNKSQYQQFEHMYLSLTAMLKTQCHGVSTPWSAIAATDIC